MKAEAFEIIGLITIAILIYLVVIAILMWAWGEVLSIFGYETNLWQRLALAILTLVVSGGIKYSRKED